MRDLRIYTTNFGGVDVVHDPACIEHEYFCFADVAGPVGRGLWRTILTPVTSPTPRRESRRHKLHSHLLFPHAEWTLYHDASLQMRRCPDDFLEWCLSLAPERKCDLFLFDHPERDCLYAEAEACIRLKKETRDKLAPQLARYREMGLPEHMGLWYAGVLLRRNTPDVKRFNEMWWWEVVNGSHRDQVSLPVVLKYANMEFCTLPHHCLTDWFEWKADHTVKQA